MADYVATEAASSVLPVEQMYLQQTQRMLQNFNSTPENDREAGFISLGLLSGVILLGLCMFFCNALVEKFWYVLGLFVSRRENITFYSNGQTVI